MPKEPGKYWKATGWYIEPLNARAAMSLIGSIGAYSARAQFAWRGMSSVDYDLVSSLQRWLGPNATEDQMRDSELQLMSAARDWGLGYGPSGHVDDLQLLADLQHYGIRTRLIDFTSNPMTALWFACQTPKDEGVSKSGILLALNLSGWTASSTVANVGDATTWGDIGDPTGNRLQKLLQTGTNFAVRSAAPNERLRAQEGFFVTSAVPSTRTRPFTGLPVEYSVGDPTGLSKWLKDERGRGNPSNIPFVAVIIKSNLKQKLRLYLESTYNRSAKILFPDFAGFKEFEAIARPREGVSNGEPASESVVPTVL